MLIRVGGGKSGIKEYLEHASKQGRSLRRDQLDERVVLAGDLDLTHTIIESMAPSGERYLHVTLSCKEDYVDKSTLHALVSGFEEFAMCAYDQREYCYYAEAHLPRVKSYLDAQSGETVVRKPHIHIVIPKMNLLSGGYLNPLGMVQRNVRYIDAFQETMNVSLGLASPKGNCRADFTGESEMIARYSGESFGTGKELKAEILKAVLLESVQTHDDLMKLLVRFGEVRSRNPGSASEYQNVRPSGAKKGVNLKEYVFGREFIGMSIDDKQTFLNCKMESKLSYDAAGTPAMPPSELAHSLEEWRDVRAKEVRWLNSGDKRAWREYHQLDHVGRCKWLDERSARFYARFEKAEKAEKDKEDENDEKEASGRLVVEAATADAHAIVEVPPFNQLQTPQAVVERGDLASNDRISGVAGPQQRTDVVRSSRRGRATARASDSVVSQYARDAREQVRVNDKAVEFAEIKAQLDPARLLAELSQSHGLVVEKYQVVPIADGGRRIQCGSRLLNVSDFLTKEVRLAWTDAAKVLQESYASQLRGEPAPAPTQKPRRSLWVEFRADRKLRTQELKAADREVRRLGADDRRQLKAGFRARTRLVQIDRSLTLAERRDALLAVRAERLTKEAELRLRILSECTRLKETRPLSEQYRDFLRSQAQAGDELALAELRCQRPVRTAVYGMPCGELRGSTGTKFQRLSVICHAEGITAQVATDGSVIYERNGQPILCDTDGALVLLRDDDETVKTALVFARRILGSALAVSGSAYLIQQVARMAGSERQIEFAGGSIVAEFPWGADASGRPVETRGKPPLNAHVPVVSPNSDPGVDQQGDRPADEDRYELDIEELVDLLVRVDAALPSGDPGREDWWSLQAIDDADLLDILSDDPWTRVGQFLRQHLDVALAMAQEINGRLTELENLEQRDDASPHM